LTGAKPPLRQKQVWAIRTKLQIEQRTPDLALAVDSKLRGCDVFAARDPMRPFVGPLYANTVIAVEKRVFTPSRAVA
jgi:hypothetical protein